MDGFPFAIVVAHSEQSDLASVYVPLCLCGIWVFGLCTDAFLYVICYLVYIQFTGYSPRIECWQCGYFPKTGGYLCGDSAKRPDLGTGFAPDRRQTIVGRVAWNAHFGFSGPYGNFTDFGYL